MMRINVWAANGLLCPAIATRSIVADAFAFRPFVRTARACGQRPAVFPRAEFRGSRLFMLPSPARRLRRRQVDRKLDVDCAMGSALKHGLLHDRLAECRPYLSQAITCGRPNAARARSTMSWITAVFRAV
jgi:hypothetical protein